MTMQGGGGMLSLEDALARILQECVPLPAVTLPLDAALGQVLAAPVIATTSLPPWDNSAMDGFAVRSADVAGASEARPVRLRVTGEVAAGHEPGHAVEAATAMRITTGAMVPPGADAVVPVEDTDAPAGVADLPASVAIRVPAESGANVRRAGDDVRCGDRVLDPGRLVGPAAIALAAAAGAATLEVHRRPRVGILATGDELTPPGEPLGPGRIHDSNSTALLAQARAAGAVATSFGIAPDDPAVLRARLAAAIAASDVVVLSGGVSVGAHDHVRDAFEALGRVAFWRVAIQPGKPLAFGRTTAGRGDAYAGGDLGDGADPGGDLGDGHAGDGHVRVNRSDADRPVALFGLPGNPVSAFVTFELFVRPLLRVLMGHVPPAGALVPHAAAARRLVTARLAAPVTKSPGRRAFLRVTLEPDPSEPGRLLARPAGGQGSHVLSALAAADGLAVVPESVPGLPAGHEVEVWVLEGEGA